MKSETTIKGWSQKNLGDVLKIGSGKDHKHLKDGDIPVFGTGGLMRHVDTALHEGETVFIGRKGTINKPFYYNGKFWTVDTLFYTYDFKDTSAKYINYVFEKINWLKYNEASGVPSLSKATIEKIPFVLPSDDDQERIVRVLETWDKSISYLKEKISLKKEARGDLMKNLLTGAIRLDGYTKKWKNINLGDSCKNIKTGKLDANAMVPDGKYRFYTCAKDYYSIDKYAFDTEALLISGNGANVGYVHYYKGKFNAYQRTYVLYDFVENILFIKYLLDVFLKVRIREEVREGNTPYITIDTLTDMKLKIPCFKEQQSIVDILRTAEEEIMILETKLEYLKDQKKYLLDNLLSGKIRTPESLSTTK
jgi:type I restriction enzyme S subunit